MKFGDSFFISLKKLRLEQKGSLTSTIPENLENLLLYCYKFFKLVAAVIISITWPVSKRKAVVNRGCSLLNMGY